MFIDGKMRNMPKFQNCVQKDVYKFHVSAFKYSLSDLHTPPLKSC